MKPELNQPLVMNGPSMTGVRFHVPFEHGAWWSFYSVLVAGLGLGFWRGVPGVALASMALLLSLGFIAQDWAQAVLAALLRRRSQALSHWKAWQGWALALAAGLTTLVLFRYTENSLHSRWLLLFAGLSSAVAVVLVARIAQAGRGRRSLAFSALLLATPALAFGIQIFGFTITAVAFWAWPLFYYPAATLAAQSFIRGFPESARWAGPALAGVLAGLSLGLGAVLPGLVLAAQALRLQSAITTRWRDQPTGMPAGQAIRRFGQEQAAFGVTLTLLWAWSFR